MAIKTVMLRKQLLAAQNQRAALETRETELNAALDEADDIDPELEQQVNELESAIEAADAAIARLTEAIDEAEAAAAAALADSEGGGPDNGAGTEPGQKRGRNMHNNPERLRAATEFHKTGRRSISNVANFIRSAVLASGQSIAKPVGVSGINELHEVECSSLIDMLTIEDCTGMGTHRVAYEVSGATAAATSEGAAPAESEPGFAYVDLTPTTYGTLAYVSKEIKKQTPLLYEEKILKHARTALRKKLSEVAVDAILASPLNDAYTVSSTAFDAALLSNIILAYGGDEGVEGNACLLLTKEDLRAFAAVRGKNEYLPVYSITPDANNPNTGVIKDNNGLSCRYCLNKNVTSLSTATQGSSAIKTMAYGNLKCAELDTWGGYDVIADESYKFAEGLITIRGDVEADVDVVVNKGFVVVTLAASAG